jgi:hypothetical protein
MEAANDRLGYCGISHFTPPIGPATAGKTRIESSDVSGIKPVIRRDGRTNHLDKLNMEDEGMRLGHRRPPIIRRRDNAAHDDQ